MKINIQNVRDFLSVQSSDTKIYIGVDSTRINSGEKWFADYTAVIVVHIDGKHGCKIFGETQESWILISLEKTPASSDERSIQSC